MSGLRALIDAARRLDLALPDPVGRVDDLALEVADVDDVEVDDADRPDARRREVQRGRRTEAAGADEQRLRAEELRLAGRADLGDQQMAAVALLLLGGQDDRRLELEPGALPGLEPAAHRGDVGVAHLGEGLGREQRADAAGAVQDRPGRRGRGPRPRSAARCRTWTCGGRRAGGPAPTRRPRGRRRWWRRPRGRASTSCGLTSLIWARASRRRSA